MHCRDSPSWFPWEDLVQISALDSGDLLTAQDIWPPGFAQRYTVSLFIRLLPSNVFRLLPFRLRGCDCVMLQIRWSCMAVTNHLFWSNLLAQLHFIDKLLLNQGLQFQSCGHRLFPSMISNGHSVLASSSSWVVLPSPATLMPLGSWRFTSFSVLFTKWLSWIVFASSRAPDVVLCFSPTAKLCYGVFSPD